MKEIKTYFKLNHIFFTSSYPIPINKFFKILTRIFSSAIWWGKEGKVWAGSFFALAKFRFTCCGCNCWRFCGAKRGGGLWMVGGWWVVNGILVSVIDMDGHRASCLQLKCVLHNFKASLKRNAITGCDFVTETILRSSSSFALFIFFGTNWISLFAAQRCEKVEGGGGEWWWDEGIARVFMSHASYTCYLRTGRAQTILINFYAITFCQLKGNWLISLSQCEWNMLNQLLMMPAEKVYVTHIPGISSVNYSQIKLSSMSAKTNITNKIFTLFIAEKNAHMIRVAELDYSHR